MTIRCGLQIPNFSYGTPVADLFPTVVAQAREAEDAGFDSVFVMDHFTNCPCSAPLRNRCWRPTPHWEPWRPRPRKSPLGTLVTGNTYRNPTLLAKAITTLDVISQEGPCWV